MQNSRAKTNTKECRINKIVEQIPFHLWRKPTTECVSVCWLLLVLTSHSPNTAKKPASASLVGEQCSPNIPTSHCFFRIRVTTSLLADKIERTRHRFFIEVPFIGLPSFYPFQFIVRPVHRYCLYRHTMSGPSYAYDMKKNAAKEREIERERRHYFTETICKLANAHRQMHEP